MTVIYEKRTYAVKVGEMNEAKRLYAAEGWPALSAGGHDRHLIGYFISDTGDLHQLIQLWKFDSDENVEPFGQSFLLMINLWPLPNSCVP